jgi:hypothetical protein
MLSWSIITAALALVGVANAAAFYPRDSNGAAHLHKRDNAQAEAIKEAYTHSWNGYVQFAFGHDELLSVSNQPSDSRYVCLFTLLVRQSRRLTDIPGTDGERLLRMGCLQQSLWKCQTLF